MFWAGRSLEDDLLTTPSIDPIQPNFVSSQIPPKKQALILSSYYRGILGFPCLPLPIIPIFCGTLSWSSLFLQYLDHFQQVKANIPQELCKNGQVWRSNRGERDVESTLGFQGGKNHRQHFITHPKNSNFSQF